MDSDKAKFILVFLLIALLVSTLFFAYSSNIVFDSTNRVEYTDFTNPEYGEWSEINEEKIEIGNKTFDRKVIRFDKIDGWKSRTVINSTDIWGSKGAYYSKSYILNAQGERELVKGVIILKDEEIISQELEGNKKNITVSAANYKSVIPPLETGCSNATLTLYQDGVKTDGVKISNLYKFQNHTLKFSNNQENIAKATLMNENDCSENSTIGIKEMYVTYK